MAGCWFGVNGATGLLQAALSALAGPGQAVLLPRNAHRSLIAACVLGGIRPVFLPTGSAQGGSVETRMTRRWSSAHAERRYCPGGSSSGRGTSSALHARTQPTTHQPYHVATAVCCGVCRHCDNANLQHHLRTSSSISHAVWRLVQ